MKNKSLGAVLFGMGAITLLTTLIDYSTLVIPLNLRSKEWVFSVTQSISDISIMPVLGIVFMLAGIFFLREKEEEVLLNNIEKGAGILSLIFAIGFSGCAVMYAISAGGVENNIVENLKAKTTAAKEQLSQLYEANKEKIDQVKYTEYVESIDKNMMMQVSQTNSSIKKSTFKTMLNLLLFSLLNLFIFLKVFELIDFIKYKVLKLPKKALKH